MYRKYVCRTNLDSHKMDEWPEDFVGMPQVGQWVKSAGGRILKIVSITHCCQTDLDGIKRPLVVIELHK